jgi:hypothetical protein
MYIIKKKLNMPKTKREVNNEMNDVYGKRCVSELMKFVKNKKPRLWGANQPIDYLENNVLLTLYRIKHNLGYEAILKDLGPFFNSARGSLQHNINVIRPILREWEKIKLF